MLMALGPFRFNIDTQILQSLTDRETARIASMDRAGAMPAKQFLGPGDRKIELRAIIYQEVLSPGGPPQIELMGQSMRVGERLPLVALAPAFYGFFLIEEVTTEGTHARADGSFARIDVTLTLTRQPRSFAIARIPLF